MARTKPPPPDMQKDVVDRRRRLLDQFVSDAIDATHSDRAVSERTDLHLGSRSRTERSQALDDAVRRSTVDAKPTHAIQLGTIGEHLTELSFRCSFDNRDLARDPRQRTIGRQCATVLPLDVAIHSVFPFASMSEIATHANRSL